MNVNEETKQNIIDYYLMIDDEETMFGNCMVCPVCGTIFTPYALFVLEVTDFSQNKCCLQGLQTLESWIEERYQISFIYI